MNSLSPDGTMDILFLTCESGNPDWRPDKTFARGHRIASQSTWVTWVGIFANHSKLWAVKVTFPWSWSMSARFVCRRIGHREAQNANQNVDTSFALLGQLTPSICSGIRRTWPCEGWTFHFGLRDGGKESVSLGGERLGNCSKKGRAEKGCRKGSVVYVAPQISILHD